VLIAISYLVAFIASLWRWTVPERSLPAESCPVLAHCRGIDAGDRHLVDALYRHAVDADADDDAL
jgi:hypothetical protein